MQKTERASQPAERPVKIPPEDRLMAALDWLMGPDFWRRVQLVEELPQQQAAKMAGD